MIFEKRNNRKSKTMATGVFFCVFDLELGSLFSYALSYYYDICEEEKQQLWPFIIIYIAIVTKQKK